MINIFQTWNDIFYPNIQDNPSAPAEDAARLSALLEEMDAEEEAESAGEEFNETTTGDLSPQTEPSAPTPYLNEDTIGHTGHFAPRFTAEAQAREESEDDGLDMRTQMPNNGATTSEYDSAATAPTMVSVIDSCRSVPLTHTELTQSASTNRPLRRSMSPLTDVECAMEMYHQVTPRTTKNQQRQSTRKRNAVQNDNEGDENQPLVQTCKRARCSRRPKKK